MLGSSSTAGSTSCMRQICRRRRGPQRGDLVLALAQDLAQHLVEAAFLSGLGQGLVQAYLLLSQAAEQQRDYAGAEADFGPASDTGNPAPRKR